MQNAEAPARHTQRNNQTTPNGAIVREKYGVYQPETDKKTPTPGDKTAGLPFDVCPTCGDRVMTLSNVKHCFKCGSKPWEAAPPEDPDE